MSNITDLMFSNLWGTAGKGLR